MRLRFGLRAKTGDQRGTYSAPHERRVYAHLFDMKVAVNDARHGQPGEAPLADRGNEKTDFTRFFKFFDRCRIVIGDIGHAHRTKELARRGFNSLQLCQVSRSSGANQELVRRSGFCDHATFQY